MLLKKLIALVFLIAFSCSGYAGTKGAAFTACAATIASHVPGYFSSWTCIAVVASYAGLPNEYGSVYLGTVQNPTVGAGWFSMAYSGFGVCLSPGVLNYATGACYTPIECAYPETDNGSGVCANNSCAVGSVRNPLTNLCQVVPSCGSTQTYDLASNTCKLYKLNCPGHSHASTANDACLADAPLACPTGQHDDGTYTCIANDLNGCKTNQQAGYINGVPQCISKPNLDTAQAASAAKGADLTAAGNAINTAQNALNAADTALTADPTNTTKQRAQQAANDALQVATAGMMPVAAQTTHTDLTATNGLLNSIDQSLKNPSTTPANFGTVPAPEALGSSSVSIASISNYSASGSCPAPISIVTAYRTYSLSYDYICSFAGSISAVVICLAWLSAAVIVFKGA